jgi:hypothetical protein
MAKNRKKRRLELQTGGTGQPHVTKTSKPTPKAAVPPPPPPPPKGPAVTPKKAKLKRPKYVRPPRATPKPKPATPEHTGPKPLTYAAITLTSSVAKSIPKAGAELPDRPGPGPRQ